MTTVAITGATGYLGGVLKARCTCEGWETIDLVRSIESATDRRYVIGEDLDPSMLDDVDVLIHCAYDMSLTDPADVQRVNVEGTRRLLALAQAVGCSRVLVLSSMSAFEGTQQLYGRSKLAIEDIARTMGAISIRPGLVYGPNAGGMAGALARAGALPIIPVPASRSYQFTVHEEDLAEAVMALLNSPAAPTVPVGVANPRPVQFKDVISGLARRHGKDVQTIPVNWKVVYRALKLAERLPIALPFRADSLLGLARPAPSVPNLEVLAALGVTLRRFEQPTIP